MLCGLPGSGKTDYAEEFIANNDAIKIGSDDMREMFCEFNNETEYSSKYNVELFAAITEAINNALACKQNVVYDATNIRSYFRMKMLREITAPCFKNCIVVATPWEICHKTNANREKPIPNESMAKMYMSWEPPVKEEGWNDIKIEYPNYAFSKKYDSPEKLILNLIASKFEITDYDLVNDEPYEYYLADHLTETSRKVRDIRPNDNDLIFAGLLHDIGKPYTQTIENYRWYYKHHENVAAYDCLFIDYSESVDKLDLSFLIQHHGDPADWDTEEKAEKWKSQWGKTYYDRLKTLYISDVMSKKEKNDNS